MAMVWAEAVRQPTDSMAKATGRSDATLDDRL